MLGGGNEALMVVHETRCIKVKNKFVHKIYLNSNACYSFMKHY